LIDRWLTRWSLDEVEALVRFNNSRPPVYLSVVGDRDEAAQKLRTAGIETAPGPGSISLRVEAGELRRALELVPAVVQDPAAAAVAEFVTLDPGSRVIDLCAAPGGKAAALAGRGHQVWACDISKTRLARLSENRERLRLQRLHLVLADSTSPPLSPVEAVLLDAPCSGTGTLARHPDARWRLRPADLGALVELQRRLLTAAAGLVVPGGRLYYATCSLEPEENREQIDWFLSRRPDFELSSTPEAAVAPELLETNAELRVLPQRHALDGAYAARLRRKAC
jgi:16S rRNA (cytosine967-C5)-methyltransferase